MHRTYRFVLFNFFQNDKNISVVFHLVKNIRLLHSLFFLSKLGPSMLMSKNLNQNYFNDARKMGIGQYGIWSPKNEIKPKSINQELQEHKVPNEKTPSLPSAGTNIRIFKQTLLSMDRVAKTTSLSLVCLIGNFMIQLMFLFYKIKEYCIFMSVPPTVIRYILLLISSQFNIKEYSYKL